MRLIGLDPGLRATGWGVVEAEGSRLAYVASGTVRPDPGMPLPRRLAALHQELARIVAGYGPVSAAVEETFVNRNAASSLKLGEARGVALLVPALAGLEVSEYAANRVKKSIVGAGHAAKGQIAAMVRILLPGCRIEGADAADALAVAICHAHHLATARRWHAADAARPVNA